MTTPTNRTSPPSRTQKAKRWATLTLVVCGLYSIWANVTYGRITPNTVVVSVWPPIVAFLASHLISYLHPTKRGQKVLVYGGLGIIAVMAFIGSGYHIWEKSYEAGQPWYIAIVYPFLTDFPMVVAAVILVQKVSATQSVPKKDIAPEPVPIVVTPTKAPAKPRVRPSRAKTPQTVPTTS